MRKSIPNLCGNFNEERSLIVAGRNWIKLSVTPLILSGERRKKKEKARFSAWN